MYGRNVLKCDDVFPNRPAPLQHFICDIARAMTHSDTTRSTKHLSAPLAQLLDHINNKLLQRAFKALSYLWFTVIIKCDCKHVQLQHRLLIGQDRDMSLNSVSVFSHLGLKWSRTFRRSHCLTVGLALRSCAAKTLSNSSRNKGGRKRKSSEIFRIEDRSVCLEFSLQAYESLFKNTLRSFSRRLACECRKSE